MRNFILKQVSFFRRKFHNSFFIFNLSAKPVSSIKQSQILSSKSEQKLFIVTPDELSSIMVDGKECEITDLMCEAERKIQYFEYHEAEILYNLLKKTIFPKHLPHYKAYFAKILTGLGYIAFYQYQYNEALEYSAILIMTLAQLHKGGFRHFQTPSNFAANR